MDTLLQIVVIIILTMFEAVFVAAEIALVTMRRSRIDQLVDEGNRSAQRVKGLVAQPGRFLAVTQIGLTFLGFLASAYAAVNLTTSLEELLAGSGLPVLASSAGALALIIVTLILSLFTILFGELIPKSLALAHTEAFALRLSAFIVLMLRILGPIVYVLTAVTNGVANMLGAGSQNQDTMSTEELKILVERGGQQGILEAEEEQMIHAVIELGDQRIHEVMVPRIAMVTLPVTASMEQAIDVVIEQGHSRIPVYEQSIDEIVGILYAKDLLPFLKSSVGSRPNLRSILRTPVFVPESMSVDDLLHEFQRRKVHIAIVLDEYGGTAGLATIEDLLEEIVGEIQDEYDAEEPLIVRLDDDQARIDGRADIDDLAELFGTDLGLDDADEYDTVGGLIYHRLGTVPRPGDQVEMDGLTLTVETTDGRRVGKVLAVREREHDGPEDDEADR
jgi:putative hemolysin